MYLSTTVAPADSKPLRCLNIGHRVDPRSQSITALICRFQKFPTTVARRQVREYHDNGYGRLYEQVDPKHISRHIPERVYSRVRPNRSRGPPRRATGPTRSWMLGPFGANQRWPAIGSSRRQISKLSTSRTELRAVTTRRADNDDNPRTIRLGQLDAGSTA